MKNKYLILTLIVFACLISNAEASNKTFKVLFTVVPTSGTALVGETRSYIGRELRALQDVEMIEKDPGLDYYFISIFPLSLKLTNGVTSGTIVSYVIEKDGRTEHNVLVGGPDELKTLCEKVIAYFDTYWLQPQRKKNK
jgi:hypothetical protein